MNKTLFVAAGVVLVGSAFAQTAAFTPGRIVVAASVINYPAPSGQAAQVSLVEFPLTPLAASTYTFALPSSGTGTMLTSRWESTSNLNLQFDGSFFTLGGYSAAAGTATPHSFPSTVINRSAAKIPVAGPSSYVALTDAYSSAEIRSVALAGTSFYSGGNPNVRFFTSGPTSTQITTTGNQSNIRVVSVYNGDLYYGTGSATGTGVYGIHKYTGLPTASVLAVPIITIPQPGTSLPSPYDFVFTDPNTCFIADDRSQAQGGGIYKFTYNGSAWVQAALIQTGFTTGARSLAYLGNDTNGFASFAVVTADSISGSTVTGLSNVTVAAQIWQVNDGVVPTATLLQNATPGMVYRGIRYIPGAANQELTGSLNLGDTGGAFAFNRTIAYQVKQGTSTLGSGTVVASASASSFSISLPASATGAATIEWDGSSFLGRFTNVNLTGSNLAVGSVTMQNGDVDGSGEVDAVDIDEVIASFGLTTDINADVDVSGEVDAVDIDIVIANFGGVND